MKTDYQNKEMTTSEERVKTPTFGEAEVVEVAPKSKQKIQFSFPHEGFTVMASTLEEAEAALAEHKAPKKN